MRGKLVLGGGAGGIAALRSDCPVRKLSGMVADPKFADFLSAQDGVYEQVRRELAAGHKESHWMWFIFPQLLGLGHSPMARRFGLASPAEASRYFQHPVLGARLRECLQLLLAGRSQNIREILGPPDDLKLRSCLTLFALAVPAEPLFQTALDNYFGGKRDALTVALLQSPA